MNNFFVSQKVVCIYAGPWGLVRGDNSLARFINWINPPKVPIKGRVYQISAIFEWTHIVPHPIALELVGLGRRYTYRADCFRPLVETKTDISAFTRLLNPSPAPVSPDLVEAS